MGGIKLRFHRQNSISKNVSSKPAERAQKGMEGPLFKEDSNFCPINYSAYLHLDRKNDRSIIWLLEVIFLEPLNMRL